MEDHKLENSKKEDVLLEENNDVFITIYDEQGLEKEVEIIHYFTLSSNLKDYIMYTDNIIDEQGNGLIYVSQVQKTEDNIQFIPIDSQEVIDEIYQLLLDMTRN